MGKAQYKKKTQGWRHNPIRVPDNHLGGGKADGKADPAKEKQMLPILNKLKSPEYADRTWACAAICNLIQNDPATRRLFQSRNVVGELIDRLSDSVDEVVVEASGALRNLAIDGGHELCGEMANKGIMSHLKVLIGKISHTINSIATPVRADNESDASYQARKHLLSLSENVISLLWSLAEASPKTLQAVNALGSEDLLVQVLAGRNSLGVGLSLAAAQALYSLSQDNAPFRKALFTHPTALQVLVNVIQEDHGSAESSLQAATRKGKGKGKAPNANGEVADDLPDGRALLRRLLVCGVIRNTVVAGRRSDENVGVSALTNETILPLATTLLDVNIPSVVARVTELVQQIPKQDVSTALGKDLKTDHRSGPEQSLEKIERSLSTVVVALEILTNICAGLDDEEDEVIIGEGDVPEQEDEDEEMEDVMEDEALIEMGRDPNMFVNDASAAPIVNPGATLSHLLTGLQLPRRLAHLASPTSLSFLPSNSEPSIHPPTTSVLSALHLRALEALNNLLLTTAASIPSDAGAASQISGTIPIQDLWEGLFGLVDILGSEPESLKAKGQEIRLEMIEIALGCIWGLTKVAPNDIKIQQYRLQTLMDVVPVLRIESAKTRCIEALSALGSRSNVPIEENKVIGTWLMQLLTSSNGVSHELLVALINAVIDLYADETRAYDRPVFVEGKFLEGLSGIVARVKGEVRKVDKRKDRQLRTRAEEAYENLVAFIKYRRNLRL